MSTLVHFKGEEMEKPNHREVVLAIINLPSTYPAVILDILADFANVLQEKDLVSPSAFLGRYGATIMHRCVADGFSQADCAAYYSLMVTFAPAILPSGFGYEVARLCERS